MDDSTKAGDICTYCGDGVLRVSVSGKQLICSSCQRMTVVTGLRVVRRDKTKMIGGHPSSRSKPAH